MFNIKNKNTMKNYIKNFDENCLKVIAKNLYAWLNKCEDFAYLQIAIYVVVLILLLVVLGLTLGAVSVLSGIATALACGARIYSHLGHYEEGDY